MSLGISLVAVCVCKKDPAFITTALQCTLVYGGVLLSFVPTLLETNLVHLEPFVIRVNFSEIIGKFPGAAMVNLWVALSDIGIINGFVLQTHE